MSFARGMWNWLRQRPLWPKPITLAFDRLNSLVKWLLISQNLKALVERYTVTSPKDDVQPSSIIGAGTSSIVYLVGKDRVEKHFKSDDDLLNEKAIYQILGGHPRLVTIQFMGNDLIAMDWMKNGDLARFIQSHSDISEQRKRQWIIQIAESFNLLHKHQISHCDSKLENFLLDDEYNIKICDFASSHNHRAPSQDVAIQPLRYRRAVDDFDETVFNPADDIFAFGSICYEIITGKPPFSELDDDNVKLQWTRGPFPMTKDLLFGAIMKGCWDGTFTTMEVVLKAIEKE